MKRKEVEISARMRALTELVTPGLTMCDIGCDHGFVAIYLVQKGISPKVFAMDVRSGPLSRAQEHILQYGLVSQIETRLSDGLAELKAGEAEGMICAGMGGPLMIKILEEGSDLAHDMKELILQPQSEISEFRKYLRTRGFHIIKEDMVLEDGKYYPMMKVVPEEAEQSVAATLETTATALAGRPEAEGWEEASKRQIYDRFGQYLLEHKHPVLKKYLMHSKDATEALMIKLKEQQGERALARLPELEAELVQICGALRCFESADSVKQKMSGKEKGYAD